MLLKCCTQYASKFGTLSNDHRIEKCPFSVWLQRKAVPKNVQTTILIVLISHASKFTLNFFKLGPSTTWTKNIQMFKLVLEKAEEPEIPLPTFTESWRKKRNSKKISTSASLTMLKPLTVCVHNSDLLEICGKSLRKWKYQATLPVFWETCMQVKK